MTPPKVAVASASRARQLVIVGARYISSDIYGWGARYISSLLVHPLFGGEISGQTLKQRYIVVYWVQIVSIECTVMARH